LLKLSAVPIRVVLACIDGPALFPARASWFLACFPTASVPSTARLIVTFKLFTMCLEACCVFLANGELLCMQRLYEYTTDPSEQSRALYALSYTPEVLSVLQYAVSGKVCSLSHRLHVWQCHCSNYHMFDCNRAGQNFTVQSDDLHKGEFGRHDHEISKFVILPSVVPDWFVVVVS
jgi:hypothetical protein